MRHRQRQTPIPYGKTQTEKSVKMNNHPDPPLLMTFMWAALYITSGVTQPILMSLAKYAGLANPKCQLYMLFYYLGPASVTFYAIRDKQATHTANRTMIIKAGCIATIDVMAQALNYTGASMAGPTIFSIIYSSVTVWTALISRLLLNRLMNLGQWMGVVLVFAGLTITGFNSVDLGPGVLSGSIFVMVGSAFHACTYVLSEAVMTKGQKLTVPMNCAVQGIVACGAFTTWQIVYTRQHFQKDILEPMYDSGTSLSQAALLLSLFAISNLVHALTFFHTLKHFPGGATSAGVMKGLQAVLVFVTTSITFCSRLGGSEMCFTTDKFLSLVVVVAGVILFAKATEHSHKKDVRVREFAVRDAESGHASNSAMTEETHLLTCT